MSGHNKVIWSEGLFLQPQHFQQQDRYVERLVESRCYPLVPYSWGLTEFELDRNLLRIGKLAISVAAGVFPDGTPFRMPQDDPLPAAVNVGPQTRDQLAFLAIPLRRPDALDVGRNAANDDLTRLEGRESEVRDTTSPSPTTAAVQVGALRTRIIFASDVTDAYACIPIAQVVELRGSEVVLDDKFIPTVLRVRAADRLSSLVTEVVGMLHQSGDALSAHAAGSTRGGTAELAEFLILQIINRFEPAMSHFAATDVLHPETLFHTLLLLVGELSTFTTTSRRPPALPAYRHDRLRESFEPVMKVLRDEFNNFPGQRVVPIPLEEKKFGIRVATVADKDLFAHAEFILAARANVSPDELRRRFPTQLKIGPVEKIRDLVNLSLPGIQVNAIPVAPPQLPYLAKFAYFELDQSHELWAQLATSGGLALHVAGDFPDLAMECWAIKR